MDATHIPPNVRLLWRAPASPSLFRTGVSLHSHTSHSQEPLTFLARITRSTPGLGPLVRRLERRYEAEHGRPLDYQNAWWTPPASPRQAWEIERRQIEELGLRPLVSLTDHDNIEAGLNLRLLSGVESRSPIGVEWTVPFGPTYFHLGVHNLRPAVANGWMRSFAQYTAAPDTAALPTLLEALAADPGALVVLNHPLWDEAQIGREAHLAQLDSLLALCGRWLHALELNGLRPWRENRAVLRYALDRGCVPVSGGDRHALEPNADINLTNASSFAEFAAEIRDGRSEVLFLPQYRHSRTLRVLEAIHDVVRDHSELGDRACWTDRIYHRDGSGEVQSLSSCWTPGNVPGIVRRFRGAMALLFSPAFSGALRRAFAAIHEVA